MNRQRFFANGKFLLSGEYLVLKGAAALALPLKFGQHLEVIPKTNQHSLINWNATVKNRSWFDAVFDLESLEIIETNDIQKAKSLGKILKQVNRLNPKILKNEEGFDVNTNIDFNIEWGLGSSSSLIANIARWFAIDPFSLHFSTSSGSGYDVACALSNQPVFYTLNQGNPEIIHTTFNPDFKKNIYFVYLGKKQETHQSIVNLSSRIEGRFAEIARITEISHELTATHDLEEFEFFIYELEKIMSQVLNIPTVKETTFTDFDGAVKSLGAWGGDFVMLTWRDSFDMLKKYLKTKNLDVVFPYNDIVLNPKLKKL